MLKLTSHFPSSALILFLSLFVDVMVEGMSSRKSEVNLSQLWHDSGLRAKIDTSALDLLL